MRSSEPGGAAFESMSWPAYCHGRQPIFPLPGPKAVAFGRLLHATPFLIIIPRYYEYNFAIAKSWSGESLSHVEAGIVIYADLRVQYAGRRRAAGYKPDQQDSAESDFLARGRNQYGAFRER